MDRKEVSDLHDARVNSLNIDFERRIVELNIEYYEAPTSNQRKAGCITFRNVEQISHFAQVSALVENRGAGNVSFWQPSHEIGSTYIYLVHGCIVVTSAEPTLE